MSPAVTTPSFSTLIERIARLLGVVPELHLLQVEDDVGDILHHPGQGGKLVLDAGDPDRSDGGPLQGGEQDPAEGVADGVPVSAFERLGDELGVGGGGGVLVLHEAVRDLEPVQLDRTLGFFLGLQRWQLLLLTCCLVGCRVSLWRAASPAAGEIQRTYGDLRLAGRD